ncbi:AAA family ATPase [Thermaerobacter sp. PB12/4term]|uniref:AAA family ATPase n=1 Tax=Thermaerobacter sp. PB12/4term TaxID=2293838 RepID=UPI000E32CD45|nr:AAA family ATPase [Thermaerobacter sp. PB12/4term]QIA26776.1 AAA family ATPase [Thermaerobacter sp. PB12/4term]
MSKAFELPAGAGPEGHRPLEPGSPGETGSGGQGRDRADAAEVPGAGPGNGHPVRWHRLVLRGFGPFRDEVEFRFPEGLSHWVAPNESGKSTLLAGLVAVLFGLPGSNDPTRYGQARYRHWAGASRFEGELEFTAADGHRYRVVRDFERHRVRLLHLGGGGAVEVWTGTHNPAASRPAEGYEQALRRLLGVASRHVLLQVYCLEQPLPAPEGQGQRPGLAQEVQEMLAGAGTRSPSAALTWLLESIKGLTRATRDLGITTHNQRQDRAIEQVDAQIRQLEEAIRRDRLAADDLEQVRRQLAELEQRRQALRDELNRCRQRQEAWREWQRRVDRYRNRLERRLQMEQAAQQAGRLQADIALLEREETRRWPGWDALDRDGDGNPLSGLDRLQEMERQVAALRQQQQEVRARQRQAAARSLLAAWHRHHFLTQVGQAAVRLAGRVPRLAEAPAGELERLRDLPRQEAELQRQIAVWEAEERARREALDALEADEAAVADAYADVREWNASVAAAALEMLQLKAEEQRRQAEAEHLQAEARRRWGLGRRVGLLAAGVTGLLAAVAGASSNLPGGAVAALAVVVALAAGALAWRLVAGGRPPVDPAGEEAFRRRLEEVSTRLGVWAGLPPEELARLERRYREWEARREELARRRAQLAMRQPGEASRQLEEARARLDAMHRWATPFLAGRPLNDLPRVLAWWEAVSRLGRQAEGEARTLAGRLWGREGGPGGPDGVGTGPAGSGRPGAWWRLAAMVAAPGGGEAAGQVAAGLAAPLPPGRPAVTTVQAGSAPAGSAEGAGTGPESGPGTGAGSGAEPVPPESARALVEWLTGWDPLFWEEPALEAARWRRISERMAEWLAVLEASWDAGEGPDPAAVPAWPPAVVEQLERLESEGEQEALAAGGRAERLEQDLETVQAEVNRLRQQWRVLLEPAGGDPGRAREEWLEYTRHRSRRREREKELEGLLSAWEVPNEEALRVRAAEERDAALLDLKAIEELARQDPDLELKDLNPDRAREALARLAAEEARLEAALEAADGTYRDLASREQSYLRDEPINIAQAELELAELRRQREALQDELDALVLAYRHLEAAVEEYHGAYRQRLEDASSRYFSRLTGRPGRRVVLDGGFRVSVQEPDGTPVVPEQLSQGTRDQLYWSLRVAVADLLAGDVNIPFILDDPFVHWDDGRLGEARGIMDVLAADRQVILLSHRQILATWGEAVEVRGGAMARDGGVDTATGRGGSGL